jgi:hypothetical protein
MDCTEYFRACRKETLRIEKAIIADELPHQPRWETYEDEDTLEMRRRSTHVFVISVRNPQKNVTAGQISMVPVPMAGKMIYENTHELATAEQIKAYHVEQARRLTALEDEIQKQQKNAGKGADPALIRALQEVVRGAAEGGRSRQEPVGRK